MAWIESHQKLLQEPKLFELMAGMQWNKAEAIGRLHMFWWWCVDHAENGDLRKFNNSHLAIAVELNPSDGNSFIECMINAGFLEREPYFRIKNWWKFCKHFMKRRYKDDPSIWGKIEKSYSSVTLDEHKRQNQPTKPTKQNKTKQQPPSAELQAVFDKVRTKTGINLYALTNKYLKVSKRVGGVPEEVSIAVANQILRDSVSGKDLANPWPYYTRVLKAETEKWTANNNDLEAQVYKNDPIVLGDLLKGIG